VCQSQVLRRHALHLSGNIAEFHVVSLAEPDRKSTGPSPLSKSGAASPPTKRQKYRPNCNTTCNDVAGTASAKCKIQREMSRTHRSSSFSARRSLPIAPTTSIAAFVRSLHPRFRVSCNSCSSSSTRSTHSAAALSEKLLLELAPTLVLVVLRWQRKWRSSGADQRRLIHNGWRSIKDRRRRQRDRSK
jgi:hypothetical protein